MGGAGVRESSDVLDWLSGIAARPWMRKYLRVLAVVSRYGAIVHSANIAGRKVQFMFS